MANLPSIRLRQSGTSHLLRHTSLSRHSPIATDEDDEEARQFNFSNLLMEFRSYLKDSF